MLDVGDLLDERGLLRSEIDDLDSESFVLLMSLFFEVGEESSVVLKR